MARRLAAILAADMVGYSRLMAADEIATLERLKTLRQDHIAPRIAGAGGEIIKLTGDGFLALFDSAVDAVEASTAIQRAIEFVETATPDDRRIAFRIGLHVGDVVVEDGDVYGDAVNIAARLEAEARPGGVLVSAEVFRHVRGKTALSFLDVGEIALKNIAAPVRAFSIDIEEHPAGGRATARHSASQKPSIAVLPFQNMSTDPEQEYFCDGVCEDIITELSRFPEIFVIARNSSFSFKGRPVTHHDIARALGVRYMLEGSLRRAADRVRITAQLVECATGNHIWAERYDRTLDSIFELQDEITRNVVGAIAPQITKAELARASRARDIDFSSYDLALKAHAEFHQGGFADRDGYDSVIATAQRALDIDENNGQALWIQAYAYAMRYLYQIDENPDETLDLAESCVERLFRGDRSEAHALTVRGLIRHFRRAYDAATSDFRRAFELNPNFALNIHFMAWHESLVGRTSEAREHAELALHLSPRDADIWVGDAYLALAQAHFAEGNFSEAQHWGELAIQMTPRAPIRRALMIACATHLGQPDEARPHRAALSEFAPAFLDSIVSGRLVLYRLPKHNSLPVEGITKPAPQPSL